MSRRRHVHVITPGDHYSPGTGSAIPTVVHGLCSNTPDGEPRPAVVVRRDTYPDRYTSADIIEYDGARTFPRWDERTRKYVDGGLGLIGLPRVFARLELAAALRGQGAWVPSVVFAHNAPQLVPVVDAQRHIPVLYAHNNLLGTYRTWESRRVLDRAASIICVSEALADQMASRLSRSVREKVRVVHNGVDFATFRRDRPVDRSGPLQVVFVGRMIPEKGADVLVDAVLRLDRPDVHLVLVGSSGFSSTDPLTVYERDLRAKTASLPDRVEVHPFVPRSGVARILQQADVVVVPSRWPEPFALTVLEGMAAGAAVIGADIGGIPETLEGTGLLVPPGDVDALASAIESLADDESLRQRIASACRDYAEAHDWSSVARKLDETLDELV